MASVGGFDEQALRDAWARWSEHRPEDLDWSVTIELRMDERMLPVGVFRVEHKAGEQVAEVTLHEPMPPERMQSGVAGGDLRRRIASWEVPPRMVLALHEVLEQAFLDGVFLAVVRERMGDWEGYVHSYVWDRLRLRRRTSGA